MNNTCVFCRILSDPKHLDHEIVWEGEKYVAMKVIHPETEGHFIVFPKLHVSEMTDMPDPGDFFELVVFLAEKFTKKWRAPAYVLKLNNNVYKLENDPMHVGHIHMHVVPRYKTAPIS